MCQSSQLHLGFLDALGGMGERDWDFSLRNVGPHACRMEGYPGVGMLTNRGKLIAINVGRDHAFPTTVVTVLPGRSAYFTFEFETAGPCLPHDYAFYGLEVYPPDNYSHLVLHAGPSSVCDVAIAGTPLVTPVRAAKELT